MQPVIAWLIALGPLLLLAVGLVPRGWANRNPAPMTRLAGAAAWAAFIAAALAAAGYFATGLVEHTFAVAGPAAGLHLTFDTYFDALSAVMLLLVSFVGAVVTRYARNYLDGDPQHGRFMKWLCLTLAAVLTLIASGNLVLFAAAWITTSLCLHQLLTFYAERPAALLAARKKFIVSRLGEACLIGAVVLVYLSFGSVEFGTVFAAADATGRSGADTTQAAYLPWIAALLVIAALLKSAQFPFHGWLPEVMETPTPVSALLHAGIINAGGFLIVRMSHVVSLSTPSLDVLAVVGALTALFGSVVMLTQNSIKVSLAYSTVAQMGFMLLQCGLGAFSAAVLHIVGHSLYKAHAFLSSGSVVDRVKASWTPVAHDRPHPFRLLFALIAVALLTFAVGLAFGASPDAEPGVFALGAILLMALTYLFWNAIGERPAAAVVLRGAALAVVVCVGYFALQLAFEWLLQSALPAAQATRGNVEFLLLGGVIALFMVVFVLQTQLPYRADSPRWHAAYVHLFNGLYVNTVANRLIQRLWPVEPRVATQGVQE